MIIAGEASGDLHGAKLVKAMLARDPELFFCGIGGQALAAAGVRILMDASDLAVVGITEVFAKSGTLLKAVSRVRKLLESLRPDLLIIIDFPDFNLHAAAMAKRRNIPVLYYISPQVWAWRKGRVRRIKRLVDHVAVILPFEEAFYRSHGVPVTFVGHPLLDETGYAEKGGDAMGDAPLDCIGLLPGSRDKEVLRSLPAMLEAATRIRRQYPEMKFLLSQAPTVASDLFESILKRFDLEDVVVVSREHVGEIFKRSSLAVAVSGTVTLEAAISGTPTVIIYSVSPVSYWIGRALIHVEHIGLINLIAGKKIVPELIQEQASPERIADCVNEMLAHQEKLVEMRRQLMQARERLGKPGASKRASELAFELLGYQDD